MGERSEDEEVDEEGKDREGGGTWGARVCVCVCVEGLCG